MKKVILNQKEIYIHKNISAKNMRIRIDKNSNIILVLPFWVSEKKGLLFVEQNQSWIEEQLKLKKSPLEFKNGQDILFLGENLKIVHNPDARRGVWIEKNILYVSGDERYLHRRIRDFIKKEATLFIYEKSVSLAKKINLIPSKVTLRDTSSCWGSCSSHKNLSFCWKLALAPDFVLDYIIAHEVAHLQEMNHSADFWKLVNHLTENRSKAHIWLRRHGNELQNWK